MGGLFSDGEAATAPEDIGKWTVDDVCNFVGGLSGCAEYTRVRELLTLGPGGATRYPPFSPLQPIWLSHSPHGVRAFLSHDFVLQAADCFSWLCPGAPAG